jgi:hypothetical protein
MEVNKTPLLDKNKAETGCCPRFEAKKWDQQVFVFKDKPFVRAKTKSFMHIPLNFGGMMKKTWKMIEDAGADTDEFLMLSHDPSLWQGEHYIAVSKEVPGADNIKLSGTYLTKVFEGPLKETSKWVAQMKQYVKANGKNTEKMYLYYTTCPKCAKFYGKNYVVGFAQI